MNNSVNDAICELMAENERLKLIQQAAIELIDGDNWFDLKYKTGLPEERCKEIISLIRMDNDHHKESDE